MDTRNVANNELGANLTRHSYALYNDGHQLDSRGHDDGDSCRGHSAAFQPAQKTANPDMDRFIQIQLEQDAESESQIDKAFINEELNMAATLAQTGKDKPGAILLMRDCTPYSGAGMVSETAKYPTNKKKSTGGKFEATSPTTPTTRNRLRHPEVYAERHRRRRGEVATDVIQPAAHLLTQRSVP